MTEWLTAEFGNHHWARSGTAVISGGGERASCDERCHDYGYRHRNRPDGRHDSRYRANCSPVRIHRASEPLSRSASRNCRSERAQGLARRLRNCLGRAGLNRSSMGKPTGREVVAIQAVDGHEFLQILGPAYTLQDRLSYFARVAGRDT